MRSRSSGPARACPEVRAGDVLPSGIPGPSPDHAIVIPSLGMLVPVVGVASARYAQTWENALARRRKFPHLLDAAKCQKVSAILWYKQRPGLVPYPCIG